MKTLLDVHTHTIASGHAFSTLQEMTLTQETIEKRSIFQHPLWVVVFALTAAIAWGWAYPLIKMGIRDFGIQPDMTGSKMLFAGIRFFISGLIILAIAKPSHRYQKACGRMVHPPLLPAQHHLALCLLLLWFVTQCRSTFGDTQLHECIHGGHPRLHLLQEWQDDL